MILYDLMTDAELRHALAQADNDMRKAVQWGPKMAEAETRWKAIQREIERRQDENNKHR